MSDKVQDSRGPRERSGARLTNLLQSQFELLGRPEGGFPFEPPYSTPKARGALMGTVITIVDQEFGQQPTYSALGDATVTVFTLAFGSEHGRQAAAQTIADAAGGNREVIDASDRAANDLRALAASGAPDASEAFYLAVSGKL